MLGLIAIKALLVVTGARPSSRIAGIQSGDIAVEEEILSAEFGDWKCVSFQSPESTGEMSWWTHQWVFQQQGMKALVAFDQAGWPSWHELTECYQNTGWTLTSRAIVNTVDRSQLSWDYVFATFERNGTRGVLLFSEFYEDGMPVEPASFSVQEAIKWAKRNEQAAQTNDFAGRLTFETKNQQKQHKSHSRVLQCQLFLAIPAGAEDSVQPSLETLHLLTRDQIRTEWKHQASTNHSKKNESSRP